MAGLAHVYRRFFDPPVVADRLLGILARVLGFGAIVGSVIYIAWGWLRLT